MFGCHHRFMQIKRRSRGVKILPPPFSDCLDPYGSKNAKTKQKNNLGTKSIREPFFWPFWPTLSPYKWTCSYTIKVGCSTHRRTHTFILHKCIVSMCTYKTWKSPGDKFRGGRYVMSVTFEINCKKSPETETQRNTFTHTQIRSSNVVIPESGLKKNAV